jgi:glycosyltransferase involved in cell wall biosynthesis
MNKRRIFVIGPLPPPIHGQSLAVRQLVESELSRSFEFIVFNKAFLFSQIADHGKFRVIKIFRDLQLILKLIFKFLFQRPDVCYLTMAQSRYGVLRDSLIIAIGSVFCPIIIHLHFGEFRFEIDKLTWGEKQLIKFSLQRIKKAILLSERFMPILGNLVLPERICVIRNGLQDTCGAKASLFDRSHDEIKLLFLSNLQPEKGLWDLLLVLGHLKKIEVRFNAVIAGPFPTEKIKCEVFELVSELNIQTHVSLPGEVQGQFKDDLFANADVFIFLPNQVEGQPLVIIEALMAGLPIISTPQAGILDMVIDGQNGLIVPIHDTETVAKRIAELANNPAFRAAMGNKSRELFMNQYIASRHLQGMKMVFEDAVGG